MQNSFPAFTRKLTDGLSMAGVLGIVLIMGLAVFMRYVMAAPLQWVEELLVTVFIWSILLGAVSSMRTRSHVSIDALVLYLPATTQRYIQVLGDVVVIVTVGLLGWLGLELTLGVMDKFTPILKIPYEAIDFAIPTGCFLMALYAVGHLIQDVRALGTASQNVPSSGTGPEGGDE